MWMQDRHKVYTVSYTAPNGSCFVDTWTILQKPPLGGGRPNTKPGDHGTPKAHNCWFVLSYHAWGPAWIEIHWTSIWLRAQSHTTSHYTSGSVTTLLRDFGGCLETTFGHFSFGLSQLHGHGPWLTCEVAPNGNPPRFNFSDAFVQYSFRDVACQISPKPGVAYSNPGNLVQGWSGVSCAY